MHLSSLGFLVTLNVIFHLDPQFGFSPTLFSGLENSQSVATTIVVTNGVVFQEGVTRTVRINSQLSDTGQATGKKIDNLLVILFYNTLQLFIANSDYIEVINVDHLVGSSPSFFFVSLIDDIIPEGPDESFNLVLSSISGDVSIDANSSIATITIIDDDAVGKY